MALPLALSCSSLGSSVPSTFALRRFSVLGVPRYASSPPSAVVLAIKAEHPSRIWERRVPLTPVDVGRLIAHFGPDRLVVRVESSQKRIFDDQAYAQVGAQVIPQGLVDGDIVVAIKEIPMEQLPNRAPQSPCRTYCFFSHTHKGQAYNIPLLNRMVACGDQFVDWELLVDPKTAARQVSFGRLAGVVGAGEALSGYGYFALKQGFSNPFLNLPRPYTFENTDDFFQRLDRLRTLISQEGYRGQMMSIVVTGATGRVGKGVVEVLDQVGVEWVQSPAELREVLVHSQGLKKHHKLVGYKLKIADYAIKRQVNHSAQENFSRAHYDQHPHEYHSNFAQSIGPWTTLLINAAYWSNGFPRLLSNQELKKVVGLPDHRLKGVTDISCDFSGGLEFVTRATTIEAPYAFLKVDPLGKTNFVETSWDDPQASIQLISIEILPSELAKDASIAFSSAIFPYMADLIKAKLSQTSSQSTELVQQLRDATICQGGALLPQHQGLNTLLKSRMTEQGGLANSQYSQSAVGPDLRNVLILGSGLVAKPAVETLLSDPNVEVTIASKLLSEAEQLKEEICATDLQKQARIKTAEVDAESNPSHVEDFIKQAHVVVSLLPARMHPLIATACLDHAVNLVTASYISPAMAKLDESARSKGLIFLNELGLDPGIDHMTAVRLIERLKRDYPEWGIESFVSFCGGLPENSDGLLGYRFSWSPRGVLEAVGNPARFRLDGRDLKISGEELLIKKFSGVGRAMLAGHYKRGHLPLEGLANRDSLVYIDNYGLDPHSLKTMMRGTLRYEGFCEIMDYLRRIGLTRKEGQLHWGPLGAPRRWDEVIERLNSEAPKGRVFLALRRLGLLKSAGEQSDDLSPNRDNLEFPSEAELQKVVPIDFLSQFLSQKLAYGAGERDLVLLSHEIRLKKAGGSVNEQKWIKSELLSVGDQHSSAMAKTVGSPVGIGALMTLKGSQQIRERGVVRPVSESVWEKVLDRLESQCGIKMVEREFSLPEAQRKLSGGLESILKANIQGWHS